jgi:outer membrane lipase/esterase
MAAQLEQYLQRVGYVSQAQTLFVIDGITVGNNIGDALTLAATNPNAPVEVLTAAVTDVATMILRLYSSGARHILVLNSTNVGRTPRIQALGAAAVAGATQLSAQFNGALAQQIAGLRATSPGLNIYTVDVFALAEQAAANPAAFGFTNASDACFNPAVAPPTLCADPSQYFYWDPFHPTQAAGAILADRAIAAIDG